MCEVLAVGIIWYELLKKFAWTQISSSLIQKPTSSLLNRWLFSVFLLSAQQVVMRRLNYRYYSWPGTDWMSAFFFTRQELGKPANLAGAYDITAAAIYKGPVGSPTPLGWYLAEGLCHETSQWHFGSALWELHSSLKSAAWRYPWEWEEKEGFCFLIFVSWFLHVALSLWYPSTAPAQNSEPCGNCWLMFIQQHALLPHMLLL